jgi:hypothetical protein
LFWVLFGWLADYSFPFGQAIELFLACFRGTVSAKINSFQQQLQRTDIVAQPANTKQLQRLNNLESQAWLYKNILERLGADPSANHEKIAQTLEALESKKSEILQELEPRRPQNYRLLAGIQNFARHNLLASQAEKDYEKLEEIVVNLVSFVENKKPSQIILSEVTKRLSTEIGQNSNQISPYRLRLAYKLSELIKLISERLILNVTNSEIVGGDQALVSELRSRINLLSEQFKNLLKSRQDRDIEIGRRTQEITKLTNNISNLHRVISYHDDDTEALRRNVQELAELAHRKQEEIDRQQAVIFKMQEDFRDLGGNDQRKKSQITSLQNHLAQLNQDKIALQKELQNSIDYFRRKEYEISELKREKLQLDAQRVELERQCSLLYQTQQQSQNEIAGLKQKLENLAKKHESNSQSSTHTTSPYPVSGVTTKPKISVQEWKEISNQSEYIYVRAYQKKNGTLVDEHYRKRPKRRIRLNR